MRSALPDHVCYAGSVSKLLAPALRVGWLVVPPALQPSVLAAKRDADLGNAILPQLVLAELMASGQLDRHHRLLRKRHIRRRDAMIAAVGIHLPHVRVHGAAAGLHLTLTFGSMRRGPSDGDIAAAALEHGVKMHPLSWHSQRPAPPGLVLGYAASTPAQIDDGIAVVARLLGRLSRG
jgi:GntR family transcriptional regulator/MocR family aminotransferase